ncbi:DUF4105 domain-containing protein [Achromobacter insuavis]
MTALLAVMTVAGAAWGALALWFQSPARGGARAGAAGLAAAGRGRAGRAGLGPSAADNRVRGDAADPAGLVDLGHAAIQRPRLDARGGPHHLWRSGRRPPDAAQRAQLRLALAQRLRRRWETRRYDLSKLASVDLALSYWGRPAIAHALVSFGFTDGQYVVFSVEIRRKRNDTFSEIGGFFRQYELSVLASAEEDSLRVRTNVRGEDGYLYRIHMPAGAPRKLLLSYVDTATRLRRQPRFYNTLTANCITIVYRLADKIVPGLPLDYRLLLSGYLPDYLYRLGALEGAASVQAYRDAGRYTERAATRDAAQYSRNIRRGVPGVTPPTGADT